MYSNNEAEYEALLYGVRMGISLGVRRLMVYGDSDLVVNQVMKEWDVRSPAMIGYCNTVINLEKKFCVAVLLSITIGSLARIVEKRSAVSPNG